eukprot:GHRR01036731.1.p1 GENE.GHRR01036731.1~~GHRR01036731.1.p1  ORF type:complete len:112 (+),score=16.45 GHRR01036731.1:1074-1409(+)
MFMMASWMERKTTIQHGAWICANLAGFPVLGSFHDPRWRLCCDAFTFQLAVQKVSMSWVATLTQGMLCNWLVCMAIWRANAAQDIGGRILAILLPVSASVIGGYEQCVANM